MTKPKSVTTTERTTVKTTLSSVEEKVIRMRHGLAAPDSLVLEHQGNGNPELMAKLEAMERRVMAMNGARKTSVKSRIVSALRDKNR